MDRSIEAVHIARIDGHDIRLTIIGDGPCRDALIQQAQAAGLEEVVTFLPAVPYGEPLFRLLDRFHLSISTPLIEDTLRSAFDAMARGLPILAFDMGYFVGLAELSGAVTLATWPSSESLAQEIISLDADRGRLVDKAMRAVEFARANTQPIWLQKRLEWTRRFVLGKPPQRSTIDAH